jgi:hypothetical protein
LNKEFSIGRLFPVQQGRPGKSMTIGAEQCNFDVFLMMIVCLIRPVLVSAQMESRDVRRPRLD